MLTGLIAVQQENGFRKVPGEQISLLARYAASHQRNHVRISGLMNLHAVKKSFDNYNAATVRAGGAVEVEQFAALSKRRRELILWRRSIDRPACVGDQVA